MTVLHRVAQNGIPHSVRHMADPVSRDLVTRCAHFKFNRKFFHTLLSKREAGHSGRVPTTWERRFLFRELLVFNRPKDNQPDNPATRKNAHFTVNRSGRRNQRDVDRLFGGGRLATGLQEKKEKKKKNTEEDTLQIGDDWEMHTAQRLLVLFFIEISG